MQLKRVAEAKLPTPLGDFLMVGFEELATGHDHAALVFGDISGKTPVLARVHSECLTGDALFSLRCDCGFSTGSRADAYCGRRTRNSDIPPSGRPQYWPA